MKSKKKIHLFEEAIQNYMDSLDSQMESFPILLRTLQANIELCTKKIDKFVRNNGIKNEKVGGNSDFSLPPNPNIIKEAISLFSEMKQAILALELTKKNTVVAFVSIYDAFLADIINSIYRIQPGLLNTCEKEYSFVEIIKYESIEDIKEHIIEKEVDSVLRESHLKQLSWLENKLNMKLTSDLPILADFIEITERRNLFVHTNGKASRQYLSTVSSKYKKRENGERVKVGDMLYATPEYVEHCYNILFEMGVKLGQVIWRKIDQKKSLKEAEELLINIIYNLIKEHKYNMAITLSEFATKSYVKNIDKASEYVKNINKALAYYLKGDKDECKSIISQIDWSATELKFKLAVKVLEDKFDEACKIMYEIGNNDEMKENYKEWPLFKVFRERESFSSTYKDIYNTEFVIVETMPSGLEDVLKEAIRINKKKKNITKNTKN